MENLSTLKGCIDDAIASLEGLGTDEEGDSIRQAQTRLKKAMEITTALSSSLGSHRIQLEGASDEHADIARYLKGAAITGPSEKISSLFLSNTGRDLKQANVVRVRLASGRTFLLESPFSMVGAFLCGETPLEDQQCGLINLRQIESIEFTW